MIEIKRLTKERILDYFNYFETDAHGDNPNEERCYCVYWVSADQSDKPNLNNADNRKALAEKYIEDDNLQGYLAYDGNRVVGWCNTNTKHDCIQSMGWQHYMKAIPLETEVDKHIKSIYCFAIAPDMKRKGIAGQLLDVICSDAKEDGFDFVEVYPNKAPRDNFMAFMGPLSLYKKFGFEIIDETERDYVMRKAL